jgi:3-oxoacyl-[acyl-carrier-protein] synthase-3
MKSVIIGTGSALPPKILTNAELAKQIDTSDEWIFSRTGISQRHICGEGESAATLAIEAARNAIESAKLTPQDIEVVIVANATPDRSFPSLAADVHKALEIPACPIFDLNAACSGFIYNLKMADMFIQTGTAKNILIIGAEVFSRAMNWEDRSTCVLFGDGAGAAVVQAQKDEGYGLIGAEIGGDGKYVDLLKMEGGIGLTGKKGVPFMNGREVFKNAVRCLAGLVPDFLEKYDLNESDINWLVPHQANARIIEATAKLLELPMEKVILTVAEHANTSAASIPLAMDKAAREGRFKDGDILFLEAFGAGFTWGASAIRWKTIN